MIWINDTSRHDWAGLAKFLGIRYIRKEHTCVNPLEPPPGCPISIWFQAIAFAFCQAFGLMQASQHFLYKMLIKTYNDKGRNITFKDLEITYRYHKPKSQDEAGYRARTLEKLEPINLACPEMDYEKGFDLSFFICRRQSVIWEMADDENVRGFLTLYHLYYMYHFRNYNPSHAPEPVFVILDEILHPFRARSLEAGLPLSTKLITQLQGLVIIIIFITQLPRLLDDAVKSNLNTVFGFCNRAEQVPATGRIQNLPLEIQDCIPSLATGQAVVTIAGDRLKGPALVDTPLYPHDVKSVSPAELDHISLNSIKDLMPATKKPVRGLFPSGSAKADLDRLSADGELLLQTYESCPLVMKLMGEYLKWTPTKLSNTIDEIIHAGIWDKGPTFGLNYVTVNLTSFGKDYCDKNKITIIRDKSGKPYKDRVHQIGINSVRYYLQHQYHLKIDTKKTAYRVSAARQIQPDGLILAPVATGGRTALQFAYHNAAPTETRNLIRLALMSTMGPDYILCVAHSSKHEQDIQRNIKRFLKRLKKHRKSVSGNIKNNITTKIKTTNITTLLNGKSRLNWLTK